MPWCLVLGGAGLYDLWLIRSRRESLSSIAKRHRTITLATSSYLLAHLIGALPEPVDGFCRFGLASKS